MILYKAIKYTIFDICINTVLDGIVNNLLKKSRQIDPKDIVEGMFFSKIVHLNMTWENCRIISKKLKRYNISLPRDAQDPNNKSWAVRFEFEKTTAPFSYVNDLEELRRIETISTMFDTHFIS